MDKKTRILIVAGLLITVVLYFINIYAAGIVFVILVTLVMILLIMQDSATLPDIVVELKEDAKGMTIRNSGNAVARKIHLALIPENIEFNIDSLQPDEITVHHFDTMIGKVKVVITFENDNNQKFTRTWQLASTEENYDPLKPMIPLFHWR